MAAGLDTEDLSEGAAGVGVDDEAAWKDDGGALTGVRPVFGVALVAAGLDFEGVAGVRVVGLALAGGMRSVEDGVDVTSAAGVSVTDGATSCGSDGGSAETISATLATGSGGIGSGVGVSVGGMGLISSTALFRSGTSSEALDLGGHSLFSLISSFAESPVLWLATLAVRVSSGEDVEPESDERFVCCSNRPMRLATLWRGRSSGRGLSKILVEKNEINSIYPSIYAQVLKYLHLGLRTLAT